MRKVTLPRKFYQRETGLVAQDLLGKILAVKQGSKVSRFEIIETEAYVGVEDRACHGYNGRNTPRVKSLYLPGGHTYVFFIYGMYFCLNVVTRDMKHPEAVLIRAVFPLNHRDKIKPTNGPGKLCRHIGIDREWDGLDLTSNKKIWIEDGQKVPKSQIVTTTRVGIDYAQEAKHWPLRFYIKDHPFVSKK